jgi:hypothetical protein
LLSYGNFQGHVTDGNWVSKPTLNFRYSVATFTFGLIIDISFDLLDSQDYIVDFQEYTLPSHHIADLELNTVFAFENVINLLFVDILLIFESLFKIFLELSVNHFIFKQHFLFDSDQCFLTWVFRVEFQPYLVLN